MPETKQKAWEIYCALASVCKSGIDEYPGRLNDPRSASREDIKAYYLSIRPRLNGITELAALEQPRIKRERRVNMGRRSTDKQ